MGLSISKDKPTDVKTKWFHDFEPTLPSLEGKTVAITGCTTGIGLVVAKACAKRNAKCVLMLNRPSARAEAAEKEVRDAAAAASTPTATATAVETVPCDLQDFESVKKAAELIKSKYEAVDVLCNNAGIFLQEDAPTKDGYDVTMQTNYLSHFLLTKELFPLLQRARELRGEARVVNHAGGAQSIPATPLNPDHYEKRGGSLGGNGGGMMSGPRWERYHQSKLASAVFTLALRDRLGDGSGVLATCADPGISATHIQVSASRSGGMGLMLWMFTELVYQSAEDGAMPILQACFDPGAASGDQYRPSGRMAFTGPAVKAEFDKLCSDPEARNVLWAKSEEACGKFEI